MTIAKLSNGKIRKYSIVSNTPEIKFLMNTTCEGNNSFRSKLTFVSVCTKVKRKTLKRRIRTPALNSSKFKDPPVIAIIRPKSNRKQNRIWTFDIFSFKNRNPKIKAKMISDFEVKELIIDPASSKPIKSKIGTALKVIPIIIINLTFDFFFQP